MFVEYSYIFYYFIKYNGIKRTVIAVNAYEEERGIPQHILNLIPRRIAEALQNFEIKNTSGYVEEIRLRYQKCVSVTSGGINYRLNVICNKQDIENTVAALCDGSLYAHIETIKNGYISLKSGIRVGVCGRASYDSNGEMIGISDITSLCIRIPHKFGNVGKPICELLNRSSTSAGILIYSPPGEGKTTLLRGIAEILSSGSKPLRVVIVDTRGELSYSLDRKDLCIDILSGYSKAEGISIAARTMSAQVIICDEIGNYEEAESIVYSHNCGIPLIASAHANDIRELMNKPAIYYMYKMGIFAWFVGIKRCNDILDYNYHITGSDEINDLWRFN